MRVFVCVCTNGRNEPEIDTVEILKKKEEKREDKKTVAAAAAVVVVGGDGERD